MIDARINKPSYIVGEELQLFLDFSSNKDLLQDKNNINVNISRITKERNQFAFGFGYIYEGEESIVTIKRKIPENFKEGLYLVSGLSLIPVDTQNSQVYPIKPNDITTLFFWVSEVQNHELSALELTNKINNLDAERANYNSAVITTDAAIGSSKTTNFQVLVFGVGCLIHTSQNLEGYALHPLGTGFSYRHMLEAVNTYTATKHGIKLNEVESIRTSFSSSTPLFVVSFANVNAIDKTDAGDHCSRVSENIFTILAYDRGQRPNSFATIIIDSKTGESWQGFSFPGYKGNLISDFNPTSTAEALDRLLPKMVTSSWLDLIMRIYADAKSETNPNYAFLKYWSILEMISKREVIDKSFELVYPNGKNISDSSGVTVKTNSALGRAYKYAFDMKIPPSYINLGEDNAKYIFETYIDSTASPNFDEQSKIVTLWDRLSAMYQIRNATAHSGKFDPNAAKNGKSREKLAAELWEIEHQTLLREIASMMKIIVSHELQRT